MCKTLYGGEYIIWTGSIAFEEIRACLHGGGGPRIGEVRYGGSPHLSCKRDQSKMREHMGRQVTHLWGVPHLPRVPHLYVNRPLKTSTHNLRIFPKSNKFI